jgi:4-carboxymuconolactone decarboxylase
MSRLPAADRSNPELAEACAEIQATRGFVSNALSSLGNAPAGLRQFARLGEYVKYKTDLPERLRELAILCAARGVDYAWAHHSVLAVQAGIAREAVDDIGAGRTPSALPLAEQAMACFIRELAEPQSVTDDTFAAMTKHYSPRQITDVALSATYYRALGAMVLAFRVPQEGADVFRIEQDWQKSKAGL